VVPRFSDKLILRCLSAPLLEDIKVAATAAAHRHAQQQHKQAADGIADSAESEDVRVRVFLGHDVTLLALHHALGSPLVPTGALTAQESNSDGGPPGSGGQGWWPPYASALVVQVLAPSSELLGRSGASGYSLRFTAVSLHREKSASLDDLGEYAVDWEHTIPLERDSEMPNPPL
jgi:hypothetical protein